jgi:peptidoglycan-N-acetylglucosamine deacetylase
VVLLHDWVEQPWAPAALDRSATVAALPGIVTAVRARGLRLDRLP